MMKILINILMFSSLLSCGGESNSGSQDGVADGDHRIFVTSTSYTGNLGGISGANAKCAGHASSVGLTKVYKAILSDSTADVVNTLQITGGVYLFTDNTNITLVVAAGSELWDTDTKDLLNTVGVDESYNSITATPWTGSDSDGTLAISNDHCTNWTTTATEGQVGSSIITTDAWLEGTADVLCSNSHPIFCISE
jgi:hypothetical protein